MIKRITPARQAALNAGERMYVEDKACTHGHRVRYAATGNCVECRRRNALAAYADDETTTKSLRPGKVAALPERKPPVSQSDWLRPPTLAQLMAGR